MNGYVLWIIQRYRCSESTEKKKNITVQVLHDADSVVPNPPKVIP